MVVEIWVIFVGFKKKLMTFWQALHSWVLGVDNLANWQKNMLQLKRFGRLFGHKSADS
jgi:hypothetical protein